MHMSKVLALVALFAGTALAAPAPDAEANYPPPPPPKHTPPPQPTQTAVNQQNTCGNNATPYCCTSENGKYTSCYAMSGSSQCSTTVICCNANNSVQACVNNNNVVIN